MIEILNPDLTPFDNLIPVFQAGEDSPAIPSRSGTLWAEAYLARRIL